MIKVGEHIDQDQPQWQGLQEPFKSFLATLRGEYIERALADLGLTGAVGSRIKSGKGLPAILTQLFA